MSNTLAVTDMVANEALRIAHEKLSFIGTVDRQFDESFQFNPRNKIGQTLRVRSPNQYTRRQGSRVMDVQDQNEVTQTITVATQDGVDMRFNSQELIQAVKNEAAFDDLSKNYIAPAMAVLCSGIESDFLAYATKATFNLAGTAGTIPGTSGDISALYDARTKLNQQLAPKDGSRFVQIDSRTMGTIATGVKSLFHDGTQIKEAFREGFITRSAMADFYENERVYTHTNGSDVTGTLNESAVSGVTDLDITGFSAAPSVGSVFTMAGVYDVHPETKVAYASLKQFVVVSATTTNVVFSPALITSGARQNASALPASNATLTFVGSASTGYVQNLMYHKDAFQFITADLPLLDDAQKCVRKMQDNLSIRVWMASDIRNDELLMRLDILYGMAALRPEWACRITC